MFGGVVAPVLLTFLRRISKNCCRSFASGLPARTQVARMICSNSSFNGGAMFFAS